MDNLLTEIPTSTPRELTQTLISARNVRVERIISTGHASEIDKWYDQDQAEWVAVLAGEAQLQFDDSADLVTLRPGDWINIAAHRRHRVHGTSLDQPTVWLAVFYDQ